MKHFLFLLILLSGGFVFAQQPKVWTLEECVNYALENNLNVKQSEYSAQLQEVEVARSKSNFLPSLSASTSAGLGFGSPIADDYFSNSLGLSSSTTLYNGGRNKLNLKSSFKNLEISELNTETIKSDLAIQVVSAYLNVLYNRENVRIAEEQLNVGQQLVERMKALVEAGVNARNDLYEVEATLATNEESLVSAQNNLDVALLDLAQLIQVPFQGFNVADVPINIEQASLMFDNSEVIYQKALAWRPEIISAEKGIESADLDIAIARTGKRPTISASYSFGSSYLYDLETAVQQQGYFDQLLDGRNHNLGVTLSLPIFDQNSTRLNTQRANIQREIALNSLENEKIQLHSTIEKAYLDAITSLKTLEASKKTMEAQDEAFRTAQERYDLGVLTSYDFEQVRNRLVQAQSSYINAKYNFVFKSKYLEIYYGLPVSL